MSFQQGLSGLNSSARALDVIGNNIANSATVGFKSATAHFADVYANSLAGAGTAQTGIGTTTMAIQQNFTQGNVTTTNNPLDIAINGGGFFRMSDNGTVSYSRNGQFHLDKNGYVIDDRGRVLTGYPADATGTVVQSSPVELQMDASDQNPVATGQGVGIFQGVRANVNLDSRSNPTTWVSAQTATARVTTSAPFTAGDYTASVAPLGTFEITDDTVTNLVIDLTGTDYTGDEAGMIAAINTQLAAAGSNTLASYTGGRLVFTSAELGAAATQPSIANVGADLAANGLNTFVTTGGAVAATAWSPDPSDYNWSTALSIYDTLGNSHTLSLYAVKTATPGQWEIHANVDGTTDANVVLTNANLLFDTSGNLISSVAGNGIIGVSIDLDQVMADLGGTNSAGSPLAFNLDFTGSSQYGRLFGANRLEQDGYTSGRLAGVSVSSDGVIRGNYTNGQARDLGQVVLAGFTNPNGLISLGGNQWAETAASGAALVGAPGSASLGVLQSAAVEESNTDLTAELVSMITQQRNYQANAQSIKTQDQILQTLVNLR